MSLKNKVAIVTGAKQGIGFGIASVLSKAGCKVVITDLVQKDCDEALKKLGGEGLALKCDVTKKADVEATIAAVVEKFGQLDILVNNAGIYPYAPFATMKEEDWDKVFNVNVKSVYLTCNEALKVMKTGGRIINISSIASFVAFENLTHYCASKGALTAMIRALAVEVAPKGITVNNVAPGAIATPGATGAMDEKTKQQFEAAIPLKRMGRPEDIGNAVAFLAMEESEYITGQTITVDGGWTLK